MTERQFQREVITTAHKLGWRTHHTADGLVARTGVGSMSDLRDAINRCPTCGSDGPYCHAASDQPCGRQVPPAGLREQVERAIDDYATHRSEGPLADAVLAVFAERERLLRERIEALTMHHAAESGLGAMLRRRDVLAEIDRHA